MNFRFPLTDVKIEIATEKKEVENPLFRNDLFSSNQNEFSINIEGVAYYYVSGGSKIEITPASGASNELVELFLNNWGVVGILHQRKILNFHSSSFNLNGKGIMVCGDSGAGKSSLTAAFSLGKAQFLSDDVTIVKFQDNQPFINQIPNRIALKEESVKQLNLKEKLPVTTNPLNQKKLYEFKSAGSASIPLKHVIWLNIHKKNTLDFLELNGLEKFTMLRGEICGWEMLNGMKETETVYMKQLLEMSNSIRVTKVMRPGIFPLKKLHLLVLEYLTKI